MKPSKFKNDYIIFFDNTRVDHLVSRFSTSHSIGGGMPTANIEISMQFDKNLTEHEYDLKFSQFRDDLYKLKSAIKEKTNVFIFVKNIVSSNKYHAIFNGNISHIGIQTNKSRRFVSLRVSAVGGISLLNQIESILSIPIDTQILSTISPEAFKLVARTLDLEQLEIQTNRDVNLDFMTIREIVNRSKEILNNTNKIYRDPRSVSNFNAVADRIEVCSDIDPTLLVKDVLDWGFATESLIVETLYVTLAKRLQQIMLEFYEMPDGEIVIKAPYWNTPILYNHIVLDTMIVNEDLNSRWDNRVTRTLVRGNIALGASGIDNALDYSLKVPMATYTENFSGNGYWADLRGTGINEEISDDLWKDSSGDIIFHEEETGSSPYDHMNLVETGENQCLAFKTGPSSRIPYSGWRAVVRKIGKIEHIDMPSTYVGSKEDSILIQYQDGPYKGFFAIFGGIKNPSVSVGEILFEGDILGRTYAWSSEKNTKFRNLGVSNFFIRVVFADYVSLVENNLIEKKHIYINPKVVLRDFNSNKKNATTSGILNVEIGDFGAPTDIEMFYGMKMKEESQPLIRYNRYEASGGQEETMKTLKQYAAYRFKSINANVNTLSLTTLPMPWVKPGFNMWVDPTGLNEIYYVNSVSHSGGPGGIFTNLHLTMGRAADKFFEGDNAPIFGSVRDGGTFGSSIFITRDVISSEEKFNALGMVKSHSTTSGYKDIVNKAITFKTNPISSYSIEDDAFLRELYTPTYANNLAFNTSPQRVSDLTLKKDANEEEITQALDNLFSSTQSEYAKARAKEIKGFVSTLKQTWSNKI